jgi:S-ribosylhomocysteine lyase LuxS involved in autoinducer biosynthesis
MPLVRIDHAAGKPAAYRAATSRGVHDLMIRSFDVPDDDRFQIVGEHVPGSAIVHVRHYLASSIRTSS